MVFTPWVDNDVSMHKVVGLVVLIPEQQAQDHRNRSPDAKVIMVFVKHVFMIGPVPRPA